MLSDLRCIFAVSHSKVVRFISDQLQEQTDVVSFRTSEGHLSGKCQRATYQWLLSVRPKKGFEIFTVFLSILREIMTPIS